MKIESIIKISFVFLLGFLSANLVLMYTFSGFEIPISGVFNGVGEAPSDYIKEEQIKLEESRLIINVENVSVSRYAPTGSMKPVLDYDANGLRIVPNSEKEIRVGDIITYKKDDYLIVHRVVEIGKDEDGIYFITKGDNNKMSDGKIRFKDIKYKTIGILW